MSEDKPAAPDVTSDASEQAPAQEDFCSHCGGLHPGQGIVIRFDGKSVTVKAPFDDQILCYGLLRVADKEVEKYQVLKAARAAQMKNPLQTESGLHLPAGMKLPSKPPGR